MSYYLPVIHDVKENTKMCLHATLLPEAVTHRKWWKPNNQSW